MTFDLKSRRETGVKKMGMLAVALLIFVTLIPASVMARDGQRPADSRTRYIIEFQNPPLAAYEGQKLIESSGAGTKRMVATAARATGERKLDSRSKAARDYLDFITAGHQEFTVEASRTLRRTVKAVHRYRVATNGLSVDLSEDEAAILALSPEVKSITRDRIRQVQTYAGPKWIGAGQVWSGQSGFPAAEGEGIVIGIIDSGVNWDSPSFIDPTIGGYAHTNPRGATFGLCNEPEVMCNNKLIGVWDFVSDVGSTDEVEESTNGKDLSGHGSHVASIAAGNLVNVPVPGKGNQALSGVAPKANLVTYRVCHTSQCPDSFTLAAIDQAILDQVDVLNFSVGGMIVNSPWQAGSVEQAFLRARDSGIFTVTSAGNEGPDESTIGSPANAPWMVAVGYATHNVGDGSILQNMVGGDSMPPADIVGASLTGGTGQKIIVHARDYGNALCGEGEPESGFDCNDNSGLSSPWKGTQPFNGEIVICDRGTYGRVEKGKNLLLAGAGGYILANTDEWGESLQADEHCLPGVHITAEDGDTVRSWVASGSGHGGALSGFTVIESDSYADQVNPQSSRGPALPPVEDTLKPNVIAPGVRIFAATQNGQGYDFKDGTSMASPHVAGAAALVKSVHRDWNVSQLVSAIETTSSMELGRDFDGSAATAHEQGAGHPQLGEAVNTGLYLGVTTTEFLSADPAIGGNPGALNLSGLVNAGCRDQCSFSRSVTDQMGGGNWTAQPVNFPGDVQVTITPSSFTLGNGDSRDLTVVVDLGGNLDLGEWVYGNILLSAAGSSDQYLTVAVKSHGGDLPASWTINDNRNGGWKEYPLSDLTSLPDATFTSGGLQKREQATDTLDGDFTNDDPYDGGPGIFTTWHSLPQGALWLYAETLASSAEDLDLYVGRDDNGNGLPDASEERCSSRSESDLETCELFDQPPGEYWILVQNWLASVQGNDAVTLVHSAIEPSQDSTFAVSGPGMTSAGEVFPLRLSWDNVNALPGEQWFGAIGVGSSRDAPNNLGVVPVRFNRTGIAAAETFPLSNGTTHHLALDANDSHDRLFIDVPPGTSRMTVFANGADAAQNDALTLELKRLTFDEGLSSPPFATSAANAPVVVSASGVGGAGPSITVIGVEPGRWYAVLSNSSSSPSAIDITATVEFQGSPIPVQPGLWEPNSRPGLGQGYEDNRGGSNRALVWYTYDEDGQPTWYIAGNPVQQGNIWTAELRRYTNDGSNQQSAPVGRVSVTMLAAGDALFSFTLFGHSGSDRMQPISPLTCPQINGSAKSYTGLWYRGIDGLGGASVLVSVLTQAQIHYLFDDSGESRWLFAQDLQNPEPTNGEIPILQFHGYCAVCAPAPVGSDPDPVGLLTRSFDSETAGSWILEYLFNPPLSGMANRTDPIVKLTNTQECQ